MTTEPTKTTTQQEYVKLPDGREVPVLRRPSGLLVVQDPRLGVYTLQNRAWYAPRN